MADISTTSPFPLNENGGARAPSAAQETAFDTAIQSVQERPENESGARPDSDGEAAGGPPTDTNPTGSNESPTDGMQPGDAITSDSVSSAAQENAEAGPAAVLADTASTAAPGATAELYAKLRHALAEHTRGTAEGASAFSGLTDDEVLANIADFPSPDAPDLMRYLADAVGLYGGKEGETDVSPAQQKALYGQLLLALTENIDWQIELATAAADGANVVTSDGDVLLGATGKTLADAAAAIKDKIRALLTSKVGGWAASMTDQIASVLIADPTLFLSSPPATILYGSLEWAQLRMGIEIAGDLGLDYGTRTADELMGLGKAAMTAPAAGSETATSTETATPAIDAGAATTPAPETVPTDAADAVGHAIALDPAASAVAARTSQALLLVARATGKIDAEKLATAGDDEITAVLEAAARAVFAEDFAFADALDAISQDMPTRQELGSEILQEHGINPEAYIFTHGGLIPTDTSADELADQRMLDHITNFKSYYFEHDNPGEVPDAENYPVLSDEFDRRFNTYKTNFANAMSTIIDHCILSYATDNNINLDESHIEISLLNYQVKDRNPRFWGIGDDTWTTNNKNFFVIKISKADLTDPKSFTLSMVDLDKGLQEYSGENQWLSDRYETIFESDTVEKMRASLADNHELIDTWTSLASAAGRDYKSQIVSHYESEVQKSHESLRGNTALESLGNYALNLIPFRAMIVSIQKGETGGAILNGLLDIATFIPFVGEAVAAARMGVKAVAAGVSAALRATLKEGLTAGLSLGLKAAAPLGREFGTQLLKVGLTGLENALPIPTPGLTPKLFNRATETARIVGSLKDTQSELATVLEQVTKRSNLVDIADDGAQTLASGIALTKDAKGLDVIKLDAIHLSLADSRSIDLDDVTLTIGRTEDNRLLFLKEHTGTEGAFYTLADPTTGLSYGARLTPDEAGWLVSNGAKIGRLSGATEEAVNASGTGAAGPHDLVQSWDDIVEDLLQTANEAGLTDVNGATTEADTAGNAESAGVDKTAGEAMLAAFVDYERTDLALPPETKQEDVLLAYFKLDFDPGAPRRLEDDADLMLRLAQTSGLYEDDVTAADLSLGQKRELAKALLHALTKDIDWESALGADASDPTVWYDGMTLRNATGLSIAEAATQIEAKINRLLLKSPAYQNNIYIKRQLRLALIDDPTLSLDPPPDDIIYGSRDWAKLWMGAQMASHMPDLADLSAAELQELGQAGMLQEARDALPAAEASDANAEAMETNPESGMALFLMANAAGKLEATDNSDAMAVKLANFAEEEFRDELALTVMPTREQIAKDELKKRGIDPDWILLDYDEVSNPAGYLLFGPSATIGDYYFKHGNIKHVIELVSKQSPDGTLNDHLPGLFSNNAQHKAVLVSADDLSIMASDLPAANTLNDLFNEQFDNYCKIIAEYQSQSICGLITNKLSSDGFDLSQTTFSLSRPHVTSTFASLFDTDKLAGDSYFLQAKAGTATKTYFVARNLEGADSAADVTYELPGVVDDEGLIKWSRANAITVFGDKYGGFYKNSVDNSYNQEFSVEKCNRGTEYEFRDISDVREIIAYDMTRDIAASREEAAGQTNAEAAKDFLLNLIPLRQTFVAIKTGQWGDALISGYFDLLSFLPVGGPLIKTLSAGKSFGAAAFKSLAKSITSNGLKSGLPKGVASAWTAGTPWSNEFFKQLGKTALAVGDAISPVPGLDATQLFGVGKATIANVMDIAAVVKIRNVALAGKIEATATKLPALAKIDDAAWTVKVEKEAGGTGGVSDAPLYLTATDAAGNKLKLMHFSDNTYVQYDPVTLEPVGPILLPDAAGRLYKSLDVDALGRYGIRDTDLRTKLGSATRDENGVIWVDNERYAKLFDGEYLKLAADGTTDQGRTIWRVADPNGDLAYDATTPRLIYDQERGIWRRIEAGGLAGGQRVSQPDLTKLMNALGQRTILNIPKSGVETMTRGAKVDQQKEANLLLSAAPDRKNGAFEATVYPMSEQPVVKAGELILKGYWAPFKSTGTKMDFVDVPLKDPKYDFVFTAPMNGCSLIVTKLDDDTIRVFHLNNGTKISDRQKRLAEWNIDEDNIIDEISFNEYGTDRDFTSFTGMAYDGTSGSWSFFSQRQHLLTDGTTLEASSSIVYRSVELKPSGLSAAQIERYRVEKPESLQLAAGGPAVTHEGKHYIMVKSTVFEVEAGADSAHCWIINPNDASAPKIPMESDGVAWRAEPDSTRPDGDRPSSGSDTDSDSGVGSDGGVESVLSTGTIGLSTQEIVASRAFDEDLLDILKSEAVGSDGTIRLGDGHVYCQIGNDYIEIAPYATARPDRIIWRPISLDDPLEVPTAATGLVYDANTRLWRAATFEDYLGGLELSPDQVPADLSPPNAAGLSQSGQTNYLVRGDRTYRLREDLQNSRPDQKVYQVDDPNGANAAGASANAPRISYDAELKRWDIEDELWLGLGGGLPPLSVKYTAMDYSAVTTLQQGDVVQNQLGYLELAAGKTFNGRVEYDGRRYMVLDFRDYLDSAGNVMIRKGRILAEELPGEMYAVRDADENVLAYAVRDASRDSLKVIAPAERTKAFTNEIADVETGWERATEIRKNEAQARSTIGRTDHVAIAQIEIKDDVGNVTDRLEWVAPTGSKPSPPNGGIERDYEIIAFDKTDPRAGKIEDRNLTGPQAASEKFAPHEATTNRDNGTDSEYRILNEFRRRYPPESDIKATIVLFSEMRPCAGCEQTIAEFRTLYEGTVELKFLTRFDESYPNLVESDTTIKQITETWKKEVGELYKANGSGSPSNGTSNSGAQLAGQSDTGNSSPTSVGTNGSSDSGNYSGESSGESSGTPAEEREAA
ncbi:hypothetical protein ACFQU1_17675 [Chelatococcus sp. GCM10030263]|uniref:hypothetical protein n=1 Tax=Chelatococcus sp. GCM10030263 TaxID=3273387 RepID=UPI00360A2B02